MPRLLRPMARKAGRLRHHRPESNTDDTPTHRFVNDSVLYHSLLGSASSQQDLGHLSEMGVFRPSEVNSFVKTGPISIVGDHLHFLRKHPLLRRRYAYSRSALRSQRPTIRLFERPALAARHSSRDVPGPCPARGSRRHRSVPAPQLGVVDRHGNVLGGALNPGSIARILKRATACASMKPTEIAGHSLRAGLVTEAALRGNQSSGNHGSDPAPFHRYFEALLPRSRGTEAPRLPVGSFAVLKGRPKLVGPEPGE
jgi:hypothetical protein